MTELDTASDRVASDDMLLVHLDVFVPAGLIHWAETSLGIARARAELLVAEAVRLDSSAVLTPAGIATTSATLTTLSTTGGPAHLVRVDVRVPGQLVARVGRTLQVDVATARALTAEAVRRHASTALKSAEIVSTSPPRLRLVSDLGPPPREGSRWYELRADRARRMVGGVAMDDPDIAEYGGNPAGKAKQPRKARQVRRTAG